MNDVAPEGQAGAHAGIELEGVRVHNLKNIGLQIRRNALTVICGVSGSGKSSLAFDTLFAEGQRKYVETFSPYARQFMDRIERPDADRINGIPPAIAIRQNSQSQNRRSTVGTRTEVLDYLRLLFAKAGQVVCPDCRQPAVALSPDSAVQSLLQSHAGCRAMLVFVGNREAALSDWLQLGYTRAVVNNTVQPLESLDPDQLNEIRIVADRVRIEQSSVSRLTDSIEQTLAQAGRCEALVETDSAAGASEQVDGKWWVTLPLSENLMCPGCGQEFSAPTSESLNFRSVHGACPRCEGLGQISGLSFDKVVTDRSKTLRQGAIQPWTTPAYRHELDELTALAPDYDIPLDIPFAELESSRLQLIRDGVPERDFGGLNGFHRWLVRHRYKKGVSVFLNRWRSWLRCPDCDGTRLRASGRLVRLGNLTLHEAATSELTKLTIWLDSVLSDQSDDLQRSISPAIRQLRSRLQFLVDCGLGYLSLDRPLATLSGGEAQRVVLTAALGSGLINTLYVLDEPTSGLHPLDTQKVISAARGLQKTGNTVVVVEHDADFIRAADEVVEIGPGAGENGGTIVYQGSPSGLANVRDSPTGHFLTELRETARTPAETRRQASAWLEFGDAVSHNVRGLSGRLPLGTICAVTGVSGSGKSSLIVDALYPALRRRLCLPVDGSSDGTVEALHGWELLSDVVLLDQSPLPKSQRSIPATIVGGFDDIRRVLSETHEARKRNYKPGMFSFNSAQGGRCEHCEGRGVVTVEMQFLADIQSTCDACSGRRFRADVLDIRYRDRNIHDILEMTAEAAFRFFGGHNRIQQRLNALRQAGLGYLRLGQPVATLSGGESQRLRIAALLAGVPLDDLPSGKQDQPEQFSGGILFILDEPSTGLHMQDIAALMLCLNHLVEIGHSVIVIEHDPQVIQNVDYVVEMGPGPGARGGQIVKSG